MFPAHARVRPFVLIIAAVLTGGLLLLLREPTNTSHAAFSPLPTLTPVCLPLLGGGLSLSDVGYVHNGDGSATLGLGLQNQDAVDLTRISFSAAGWTPLAPAHDAVMAGLLGDHLISWYAPGGRLDFTPLFGGYSLGASERFSFTVQGFIPAQAIQLTVRKGEDVLETHTIDLSHPACDHTPPVSPLPPPTPAPPPEAPNVNVYLLNDEDFSRPLSDAEKIAMWNQGLPVPMTETVVSSLAFKPGLLMPAAAPLAQSGEGWVSMFSEDFTGLFPANGQRYEDCQLALLAAESISNTAVTDFQWGKNDYRYYQVDKDDTRTGAAWPFAGGTDGGSQHPGFETYPDNRRTFMICTFSGLTNESLKNVMAEFMLWLDKGDPFTDNTHLGDYFFMGFNTGEATFRGYRWYSTPFDSDTNEYQWERYRFFYPGLAERVKQNNGVLKIMWTFTSDTNRISTARGAWLDNLMVERYIQPQASVNCQTLITATQETMFHVSGAPAPGLVSKGMTLPPNSKDNSWKYGLDPAMFDRLDESNTHWVRLEFIAQPSAFRRLQDNITVPGTIDLKHYDRLIDGLCAKKIATLGLLSYQMLADKSWERSDGEGEITVSYLNAFTKTTAVLVDYFGDRIRAWEVWNEPDYNPTGLAARDFARLLIGAKPVIAAAHDSLVSGGLGNVDSSAQQFLDAFYIGMGAEGALVSPFDVFGLHVYPSYDYVDGQGNLLLNPQHHWRAKPPTIFVDVQGILQGDNELSRNDSDKDIWLTEFGWNSAKGSEQDIKNGCPNQEVQWVTKGEQAIYLGPAFDILFKETAWPGTTRPSITKAFWYQYHDTASWRPRSDCFSSVASAESPSWWVSEYRRGVYPAAEGDILVDWWFGLYDGNLDPNLSLCPFKVYPEWTTCYTFDAFVYLPVVSGQQTTTGQ